MHSEEKRIWGIHTKDDNLFLHQDVILYSYVMIHAGIHYRRLCGRASGHCISLN